MGLACRGRAQGGHCASGETRGSAPGVDGFPDRERGWGRVAVLGGRGKGSRGK